MPTYEDLVAQAKELMAQAEKIKKEESKKAIEEVRAIVAKYELKPQDVFPSNKPVKKKIPPQFEGPNGETWSGRGRMPGWLDVQLKYGKNLEDFRIKKAA